VNDEPKQTPAAGLANGGGDIGNSPSERTLRAEGKTLNDLALGVTAELDLQKLAQEVTGARIDNRQLYRKGRKATGARARIETALRESEQRYRQLIRSLPAAVYTCDAQGRVTFYNDAAVALWGREPEVGRDLWCGSWRIYRPDGTPLPLDQCPMAVALKEGRAIRDEEIVIERPDGTRRNVLPHPEPICDGSGAVIGAVNMLLDVTERKQIEETRARLAAIIDSSDDAIVGKTLEGVITSWNRSAERLFGYTEAEAVGQHITLIIPHERRAEEDDVLARLRRGEKVDHFETERQAKDGRKINISLTVSPIRNAEGRVIGASKVARDITERKQAEKALQELNAELERRVAERTAELVSSLAQRDKLQEQLYEAQKMESIATLAGGVAHDFNNLLNIILGYTLLIQYNAHPGKHAEGLEVIKETVQRAAALVQQLLAMARKTEVSLQEINVNAIVQKLKILLSETFPKTIEIALGLEPEIPLLLADPNQIHQAVLNLCVNARDAMPDGGKLLLETATVSGADLRPRFQEAQEERYVCIRVVDTGIGMEEVTQKRIFEPFFTTKPEGQGTGLGLSVVYGIVTKHAGFVEVASTPRQGTAFRIYLPIGKGKSEIAEDKRDLEEKSAGDFVGRGETILFVEDEEKQARLMREFLESEGYKVLIARDGAEAVETHLRHKDEIDIVVLDWRLPKLNGWDAFQRMKKIQPGLKTLFATGFLSPEIEAEMNKGEIEGIIRKPYRLNEVLEKISAAVRNQQN
jgi:PAS domain S-box-containing protein